MLDGNESVHFLAIKKAIVDNLPMRDRLVIRRKLRVEEVGLVDDEVWEMVGRGTSAGAIRSSAAGLVEIVQALRSGFAEGDEASRRYSDSIEELAVFDSVWNQEWSRVADLLSKDQHQCVRRTAILRSISRIKFTNCDLVLDSLEMNYWLNWLFDHTRLKGPSPGGLQIHFRDCRFHEQVSKPFPALRAYNKRRKLLEMSFGRQVSREEDNEEDYDKSYDENDDSARNKREDESFVRLLLQRIKNFQREVGVLRGENSEDGSLLSFSMVNVAINDVQLRCILVELLSDIQAGLCGLNLSQLLVWRKYQGSMNLTVFSDLVKDIHHLGDTQLPNLKTVSLRGNRLSDQEALSILSSFCQMALRGGEEQSAKHKLHFDFSDNFITDRFLGPVKRLAFELSGDGHKIELEANLTGNPICEASVSSQTFPGNLHISLDYFLPLTLSSDLLAPYLNCRSSREEETAPLVTASSNSTQSFNLDEDDEGCRQSSPPSNSQISNDSFFDSNVSLNQVDANRHQQSSGHCTLFDYNSVEDPDSDSDYQESGSESDSESDSESESESEPESESNLKLGKDRDGQTGEKQKRNKRKTQEKVLIVQEENAIESLISETRLNHLNFKKKQEKWN